MAYIPTTSFKEFLVEINRERQSYGNLIMKSIPAIHISYNLEHFIRSSCKGSKKTRWEFASKPSEQPTHS